MSVLPAQKCIRVFLGGTFDPPHNGHDLMLKALLADSFVDFVHLVPARLNPFKAQEQAFASPAERREWMDVWIRGLGGEVPPEHVKKLKLETLEIDSPLETPSFTIDSLLALKEKFPDSSWVFAGGSDLLAGLRSWKNVRALLSELHSFWIFSREGFQGEDFEIPAELRALCSFRWIQKQLPNLSSTEIRKHLLTIKESNALQKVENLALPSSLRQRIVEKLTRDDSRS